MLIHQIVSFVETLPFNLISLELLIFLLDRFFNADVTGNLFANDVYVNTGGH